MITWCEENEACVHSYRFFRRRVLGEIFIGFSTITLKRDILLGLYSCRCFGMCFVCFLINPPPSSKKIKSSHMWPHFHLIFCGVSGHMWPHNAFLSKAYILNNFASKNSGIKTPIFKLNDQESKMCTQNNRFLHKLWLKLYNAKWWH